MSCSVSLGSVCHVPLCFYLPFSPLAAVMPSDDTCLTRCLFIFCTASTVLDTFEVSSRRAKRELIQHTPVFFCQFCPIMCPPLLHTTTAQSPICISITRSDPLARPWFAQFFVLTLYVPNSGMKLERLDYRTKEWDPALQLYVERLEGEGKPVVVTGDFNVGHLCVRPFFFLLFPIR